MCYLGGGIYKEIAPKYTGEPIQFGSKKKNFTVANPPESAVKDPLSSDLNVGHLSDHDEAQQPSNETDLAGIEDLEDTGILSVPTDCVLRNGPISTDALPSVENRDGPINTDSLPSVENQDGPSAVDSSEPPV